MSIQTKTTGANIGTTATALIAALAGNVHGLAIALVHFLFNICGMLVWFIHPKMRKAPIYLCKSLAAGVAKHKILAPIYIAVVFFLSPLACRYVTTMVCLKNVGLAQCENLRRIYGKRAMKI